MEKLIANIAARKRGNAERTQQEIEAFVFALRCVGPPLIECRAKGLVYLALDHDADGPGG